MAAVILWAETFHLADSSLYVFGNCSFNQVGRGTGADQGYNIGFGLFSGTWTFPMANGGLSGLTTIGVAVAINIASAREFLRLEEADGNVCHLALSLDGSNHIIVKRGSGGTTIGTPSTYTWVGFNAWVHVEIVTTIADSTGGSFEIKIDGVTRLNITGVDTRNGGTLGKIDQISFSGTSGMNATDLIITDGGGFVGDLRVLYRAAASAGPDSAATASSGTLLSCVDEVISNGDTDYVFQDDSSLPKTVDFGVTALPSNVIAVKAVIPVVYIKKDDAGTNTGRLVTISGATTSDGGVDEVVVSAYTSHRRVLMTDPNTSSPWTISNANALKVGWKRTA